MSEKRVKAFFLTVPFLLLTVFFVPLDQFWADRYVAPDISADEFNDAAYLYLPLIKK